MKSLLKLIVMTILALPVVSMTVGCTQQVPPATVGILFDGSNGISQTIIKPQVVWVGPYQQLILYPTSIKQATFVKKAAEGDQKGDNSIKATTSEGAVLPIDVTLAYHVQPDDVVKAFKKFGSENLDDIQQQYLRWEVCQAVNVVSGQHSIFDLISKDRSRIGPEVKAVIQPQLAEWGMTADDVYIGEVYPSKEITEKINESLAAKADLDKSKNELQQAAIEAKTILTNARKVAEQNKLLAGQGDKAIAMKRLQLRSAAIEKWDGKTPPISDSDIPFTDLHLSQ